MVSEQNEIVVKDENTIIYDTLHKGDTVYSIAHNEKFRILEYRVSPPSTLITLGFKE